jgi:hypothetical protein
MNSHKRINVTLPNEIIDRLTKYRDSKTGFDSFNLSAFVSFKLDEYLTREGFPPEHTEHVVSQPEPASLQAPQKGVKKTKGKSIEEPVKNEPGPSHKAPIPIHEHIHRLHSETIPEAIPETKSEKNCRDNEAMTCISESACFVPEAKEQVCEADFFGNECDTIEKTEEEPIHEIQTYKGKKEPILKKCEVCGKTFSAQTKRALVCSVNCRKAKSRNKTKEKAEEV